MCPVHYRSILMALMLSPVGLGCASARLETPTNGAANPKTHTMPVSHSTGVLSKDFDPWEEGAGAQDDAHAHHHGGHADETKVDPHAQHGHEDRPSDPNQNSAPSANSSDDADAEQHEGHSHE